MGAKSCKSIFASELSFSGCAKREALLLEFTAAPRKAGSTRWHRPGAAPLELVGLLEHWRRLTTGDELNAKAELTLGQMEKERKRQENRIESELLGQDIASYPSWWVTPWSDSAMV